MLFNSDCTLYLWAENGYTRHEIRNIYWNENKSATMQKFGIWSANSAIVYFYDNKIIPINPQKDLLVRSICDFEFNNSDISKSRQELLKSHKVYTVVSVDDYWFGSLPHYEISIK